MIKRRTASEQKLVDGFHATCTASDHCSFSLVASEKDMSTGPKRRGGAAQIPLRSQHVEQTPKTWCQENAEHVAKTPQHLQITIVRKDLPNPC